MKPPKTPCPFNKVVQCDEFSCEGCKELTEWKRKKDALNPYRKS